MILLYQILLVLTFVLVLIFFFIFEKNFFNIETNPTFF